MAHMDREKAAMEEQEPLLPPPAPRRRRRLVISPVWKLVGLAIILLSAFASVTYWGLIAPLKHKHVKAIAPLTRVAEIPHVRRLVHGRTNRYIVVGDVHGMHTQLEKLLRNLDFDQKHDQLILVGDFITKGEDSIGVLDAAIRYGAACVRGNHEDEILRLYAEHFHLPKPRTYKPHASSGTSTWGVETPAPPLSSATAGPATIEPWKKHKRAAAGAPAAEPTQAPSAGDEAGEPQPPVQLYGDYERDIKLVKKMKPEHVHFIESCPSILKLGKISKNGEDAVVVHGGLEWQVHAFEEQRPEVVLRVRDVLPPHWLEPSEESDEDGPGRPWYDLWNREQARLPAKQRYEVIYGHDAHRGLQLHKYTRGLDSRCQRGDSLSAIVIDRRSDGSYRQKLHQVKCPDQED